MNDINRKHILNLSNDEKIGLIYSRSDLNNYLLEVVEKNHSNYIQDKDELKTFGSMQLVVNYAKKIKCQSLYLCFDNTYDEFCDLSKTKQRFSYHKVHG